MISNLLDRMKLPFRKNKEFLSALYDILGFYPHDIEIYRIAFSHKSLAYKREAANTKDRRGKDRKPRSENTSKPLNNERLEYLGDAVLETVVSDILFRHYPNKREGFLTATRSKIVQREALNRLANEMGLERLIQAAQGTRMDHTNIGGNAFEALMGAIYLDRGFRHCHWFIANRVVGHFVDLDSVAQKEVNFKSKLLEWSQKNRVHISFKDFANEGDTKGFESTVNIEGIVVGRGAGRSKKESQQEASKEALTRMRRDAKLYDSLFRAKEKRTAMEAEESFALPKIDEIEDHLQKGKKGGKGNTQSPVLEEKNQKGKATPSPQSLSDAAYDTAYDAEATYEVIDQPVDEPVRTAEDYEAIGLPAPPSENDLEVEEVKPTKRKSHTPRTVNDAVKGFKRNERTERPEEVKAAQQAERMAAKANKKKEKAKNTPATQPADAEKAQPKPEKTALAPKEEAQTKVTETKTQADTSPLKQTETISTTSQEQAERTAEKQTDVQPTGRTLERAKETSAEAVATAAPIETDTLAATALEVEPTETAHTVEVTETMETTEVTEQAEMVEIAQTADVMEEVDFTEAQPVADPQQVVSLDTVEVLPQPETLAENLTETDCSIPAESVENTAIGQAEEAVEETVEKTAIEPTNTIEQTGTKQAVVAEAIVIESVSEEVTSTEAAIQQEAKLLQEEITNDFIITVDIQDAQPETASQSTTEGENRKVSKRSKRKATPTPATKTEELTEVATAEQPNEPEAVSDFTEVALETDEQKDHTEPMPAALSETEPRPMLRHLSMDDFVFGMEQPEQPVLDDLNEEEDKPVRKSRSSQRRKKRKPAQASNPTTEVQNQANAPQQTLQTEWDEAMPTVTTDDAPTDESAPNKKPRRKRRRRPNKKKEE